MADQRYDIVVQDKVAKTIRTELVGIGKAALDTYSDLKKMKAELASMATSTTAATNSTAANTRALREQAAASAAAATAAARQRAEADKLTQSLKDQAQAARDLASARGSGSGAPSSPPPPPAPPGNGGAGAGNNPRLYNYGGGNRALRELGDGARISSQHLANLSFQLNDIFVSLASGQKPLTVFIQQGSQIGQIATQSGASLKTLGAAALEWLKIIKTTTAATEAAALASAMAAAANIEQAVATVASNIAAAQTEIALAEAELAVATTATETAAATARLTAANVALAESNAAAAVTARAQATAQGNLASAQSAASSATTTRLTMFGRAGLVGAIAAATLGTAVAVMNKQINDGTSAKELAKGLDLSTKEMRKMKDQLKVTFGDTFKAIFQVAGAAIWSGIGDPIEKLWTKISDGVTWVGGKIKAGANFWIGSAVGAYRAIIAQWNNFPAAIGDVFYSGVNSAIDAINKLISASIAGVNGFITQANTLLPSALQLDQITAPQIERVTNQYAGAAKKMNDAAQAEIDKARKKDYMGAAYDAVADQAKKNARKRIHDYAEDHGYLDPTKGRKPKEDKTAEKRAAALDKVNRELDSQLATAQRYGPEADRINKFEAINNQLLDKKIKLTKDEANAIKAKILAIQDAERVQSALNKMEAEILGPQREYEANLAALDRLLADNVIDQNRYNSMLARSTREYEDAIDPLSALNRELQRNGDLMGRYGKDRDVKSYIQQLEQAAEAAGKSIYQPAPQTAANDNGDIVVTGQRNKKLTPEAQGMVDEFKRQQKQNDYQSAFESMDPREREDPTSSSYLLDHQKELYDEIQRLREQDVINEEEANRRKQNLDRATLDARLEATSSVLGQISSLQTSKNKELAALGKAAAIAQATIDGYRAVQAALVGPPGPPWSFAIAGVTGAMAAANVAKIAGIGFAGGGFTGYGANNQRVGDVHANEYVFDAASTRAIGVPALEAMRRGARVSEGPANDNGGGSRGGVTIKPMPGTYAEVHERSDGEIEAIVHRVAPKAVAKNMQAGANSTMGKAMKQSYGVQRADR